MPEVASFSVDLGVGTSLLPTARQFRVGRFSVCLDLAPDLVTWEIVSDDGLESEKGFAENAGLAESDARKAAIARVLAKGGLL